MSTACVPYRVVARWRETTDAVTLRLDPAGEPLPGFVPGQFAKVRCPGGSDIALPVSALPTTGGIALTVPGQGPAVRGGPSAARLGDRLDLTGPHGSGWHLEKALGHDLLIIAYGIGLASLRPLIRDALADPRAYGRVNVLIGARTPGDLMATYETRRWRTSYTGQTVDRPDADWHGAVGPVTRLLDHAHFDPANTTACICGPTPVVRAAASALAHRKVPGDRIRTGALTDGAPASPRHIRTWEEHDA